MIKKGSLLMFVGKENNNSFWEVLRPRPSIIHNADVTTLIAKGELLVFIEAKKVSSEIFYKVLWGELSGWVINQQVVPFDGELLE